MARMLLPALSCAAARSNFEHDEVSGRNNSAEVPCTLCRRGRGARRSLRRLADAARGAPRGVSEPAVRAAGAPIACTFLNMVHRPHRPPAPQRPLHLHARLLIWARRPSALAGTGAIGSKRAPRAAVWPSTAGIARPMGGRSVQFVARSALLRAHL